MQSDLLIFLLIADLLAPILAVILAFHLKGRGAWPLWRAYGAASAAYFAWAYSIASTIGFGPSEYLLTGVSVFSAEAAGYWLVPFDHPAEGGVFLWGPLATVVLIPTFALWALQAARRDTASASPHDQGVARPQ